MKRLEMSNILNDNNHAASRLSEPSSSDSCQVPSSVAVPPLQPNSLNSSSNQNDTCPPITTNYNRNNTICKQRQDQNLDNLFRGAVMNNCTFNLQFYSGTGQRAAAEDNIPKRRRLAIVDSLDED